MARATWTAQSVRPGSPNSRVPSSGSTIHTRCAVEAREVVAALLGQDGVAGGLGLEQLHEQVVGRPVALVADVVPGRTGQVVPDLERAARPPRWRTSAAERVVGGGRAWHRAPRLLTSSVRIYPDRSHARRPPTSCRTSAALEAEAIHIIREVAAEFERPVLLFSGGKDSIVMLHLAVKAFAPAKVPFPVMHVDTGHNFAEVLAFRDHMVARTGVRLVVASVQDDIDEGPIVEDTGPRASRNRLQTVTLLRGIEEHALRRRLRRRPPRRGEGPGQGAGLQLPRRVRPVGPEEPAARAVEPLQRPPPAGRAHPGVPAVELDRARHLAVHRRGGRRPPVDLLRPPPQGVPARRHVDGRLRR